MKNNSFVVVISFISVLFVLGSSCKKDPPPEPPIILKPIPTSVTDIDNNEYQVRRFGKLLWMTENLRVTRYDTESPCSDNAIAVATYTHTVDISKPYYIDARDFEEAPDTDNLTAEIRNSLGLLYNWSAAAGVAENNSAVGDGAQGICPNGWRLPRYRDLDSLCKYLGGKEIAGEKLKSVNGWYTPSGSEANTSGLNCYPAGTASGNFVTMVGTQTMFWTSTNQMGNTVRVGVLILFHGTEEAETKYITKNQANSVRCVMDITEEYEK